MGGTHYSGPVYSGGIPVYGTLPAIRGQYYFVVPGIGSNGNSGKSMDKPLADITTAYGKCTDGAGDGIAHVSYGSTAAATSSALTAVIDWSKNGITTVGLSSGSIYEGRARISASATADLAYLIDVQGANNLFVNLNIANYGDANTALGCLKVTGNRNKFVGCHIHGGGHATPGAVALSAGSSLGCHDLNLASSENEFVDCLFGTNTIIRAAANANIVLSAAQSKNKFTGCEVLSYSATAGKGAIGLYTASALNGWIIFKDCTFTNWNPGAVTALTSVLLATGAAPNNCGLLFQNCGMIGWALWDSVTGNDKVYVTHGAGHATGGLGIVAS